jgi:hypothetical protein
MSIEQFSCCCCCCCRSQLGNRLAQRSAELGLSPVGLVAYHEVRCAVAVSIWANSMVFLNKDSGLFVLPMHASSQWPGGTP